MCCGHTAASAWLSAGLNVAKVAALLGDTKEVVLRTYANFMPEDDDQARSIMKVFSLPWRTPGTTNVPRMCPGRCADPLFPLVDQIVSQ